MVIGEATFVTAMLKNPLHLPLHLSGFTLAYRYTEGMPEGGASPETWEPSEQGEGKLQVEELELELLPGGVLPRVVLSFLLCLVCPMPGVSAVVGLC